MRRVPLRPRCAGPCTRSQCATLYTGPVELLNQMLQQCTLWYATLGPEKQVHWQLAFQRRVQSSDDQTN